MDWQLAISRNREALLRIVVALMKSLGLVDGGALTTLPHYLYRNALLILRPAEAAVRRLIMIAAYDMELRGVNLRLSSKLSTRVAAPFPFAANFAPSFNLIDPLKTFGEQTPDFADFGRQFSEHEATSLNARISATSLGRRLLSLKNALDSIQKHARRLTRWYALRDQALKQAKPHRLSPLRPGLPLGYRRRPLREVQTVLCECHGLAQYARERRDST